MNFMVCVIYVDITWYSFSKHVELYIEQNLVRMRYFKCVSHTFTLSVAFGYTNSSIAKIFWYFSGKRM